MQRPPHAQWSIKVPAKVFRDTVNIEMIHTKLVARGERAFRQLCASMDVLGDTEECVAAYLAVADNAHTDGMLYLMTYGLLQALILQQDALSHAAESIDFQYARPEELKAIRDVRNDAIGHPTKRGRDSSPDHFGIVRISMHGKGFTLYNWEWKPGQTRNICFIDLIEAQTKCIAATLQAMTEHLCAPQ